MISQSLASTYLCTPDSYWTGRNEAILDAIVRKMCDADAGLFIERQAVIDRVQRELCSPARRMSKLRGHTIDTARDKQAELDRWADRRMAPRQTRHQVDVDCATVSWSAPADDVVKLQAIRIKGLEELRDRQQAEIAAMAGRIKRAAITLGAK